MCRICHNETGDKSYRVKGMMFGLEEPFKYVYCPACQCLQIEDFPSEMSPYYPINYYSLAKSNSDPNKQRSILENYLSKKRDQFAVTNRGLIGRLVCKRFPDLQLQCLSLVQLENNIRTARILDVGSGRGHLLSRLREVGLKNLFGIDPNLKGDLELANGVKITKNTIYQISGEWDIIMFHHSFEHLSDPLETLQHVRTLLSQRGTCLIRMPTVPSYAWEHYGENWVQLDAPRHLFIHSPNSMNLLCRKSGLHIDSLIYDSTEFQFWGSEQYLRGIPLTSDNSYLIDKNSSIFSKKHIRDFRRRADLLNRSRKGDQATFYLKVGA